MEENNREKIALEVKNLCRKQGKFKLHDISFTLPSGYIMGLVGRMGSGKTTLLRSILNPSLTDSGSVIYDKQAGFIMEDAPFIEGATLKENMELFKNLYSNYDEEEFYTRLKSVGLGDHKVYGLLSKGEKVRFQFAFAMGHHPELLLLDEPTSGLDVAFRREFLYMLQEAVEKQMVSVIISTHLTDELERIADFIGVMEDGMLSFKDVSDMTEAEADVAGTTHDEKIVSHEKVSCGKIDAPDLRGLVRFCRETYLKSGNRFLSYLLCFFQFIFGCFVGFGNEEVFCAMSFIFCVVGMFIQYMGTMSTLGGENGNRIVLMRADGFFGIEPWAMWRARLRCLFRSSLCFVIVYVVQFAIIAALTGGGEYMLAVLGIILDYVIVAAVTAIVTLIFC